MSPPADPRPFVLVIAGPTASGKSRLALEIARRLPAEIVSADSMLVYRRLDIGTAKPTAAERAEVTHHLLDIRDPDQLFSAGEYVPLAREALTAAAARGRLPLLVGGTGLYLRAALSGILDAPPRDEALRAGLLAREKAEPGALHRLLAGRDPAAAARIPPGDLVRLVRALEVGALTGRAISGLHHDHSFPDRPFRLRFVVLDPPRPLLYRWIEERVDGMIEKGWLGEVGGLLADGFSPSLAAMRAVGYRELAAHLAGGPGFAETVERVKTVTRRYGKRQVTWFRSVKDSERQGVSCAGDLQRLADRLAADSAAQGGPSS
jgi:tRNA dimethylallyltransferase